VLKVKKCQLSGPKLPLLSRNLIIVFLAFIAQLILFYLLLPLSTLLSIINISVNNVF
jgi:hypothetical protein